MRHEGEATCGGSGRRLLGLVRKELLQIGRDPSSLAIAFVLPVVLLLLFGYGVSLDAERVPVAIVVESSTPEAAALAQSFAGSRYFVARRLPSQQEAKAALVAGEVQAVVVLRADFARRLARGEALVQVIVDGVDANTARIVEGYAAGVQRTWLLGQAAETGTGMAQPVALEPRVWFNPAIRSRNFLVPGLIAIIMTLIGALLTSLVVAREWERGTMEALMATPVRAGELLLGKILPYFLLGMGGMAVTTLLGVLLFQVPLRGSLFALVLVSALYMLAILSYGLLISSATRSQFVSGQIAIVSAFLPAFILSGFLFDLRSMPAALQVLTHLIPARYFVSSLQTLFLAGDIWPVLLADSAAISLLILVLLGLTARRSRKSLR